MEKTYDVNLNLYGSGSGGAAKAIEFVTGDANVYSVTIRLTTKDTSGKDVNYPIEDGTVAMLNIKPANAISPLDISAEIMDAETGLLKVGFDTGFEVLGDYTATVYLKNGANTLTWGQKFKFTVTAGVTDV